MTGGPDAAGVDAEALSQPRSAMLPADLLRDDEIIILMVRPSPLYVPLSCMTSLLIIGCLVFFFAYLARWQTWVQWTDTQAFILGGFVAAVRLGWQALEWYGHLYVLTDQRVVRRSVPVGHAKVGMEGSKMDWHLRPDRFSDPIAHLT